MAIQSKTFQASTVGTGGVVAVFLALIYAGVETDAAIAVTAISAIVTLGVAILAHVGGEKKGEKKEKDAAASRETNRKEEDDE